MKVLVIGGTIFLGRRIVEAALARGHRVSMFTRGRHSPDIFPEVERLRGDRNIDVAALHGRSWDAVVDTCGFVPRGVRLVAEALARHVNHYTFISTVSVYERFPLGGLDERAPLSTMSDDQEREAETRAVGARATAASYAEWYGALKARCERTAEAAMPGRVLTVRPGLIVGPFDYTDRFTYWVRRVARGGNVLAPGKPHRRVRVIDACDLADWIVRMIEHSRIGVFNATGTEDGLTFGRMLETCRTVAGSRAELCWTDEAYLLASGVAPWTELPLWIPEADNGIFEARNDLAIAAGLRFRALEETVRRTLEWDRARGHDVPLQNALSAVREQELLRDAPHPAH